MTKGAPSKIRLPITASILDRIRESLDSSAHPHKVSLWAIACTAFFGFFRLGELLPDSGVSFNAAVHLAWGDIAVDNQAAPTMVRVHLKKSKCDQFGAGAGRRHSGSHKQPTLPSDSHSGFYCCKRLKTRTFLLGHTGQGHF